MKRKFTFTENKPRRRPPQDDWLKYFRIARYYMLKVHDISLPDLELLLFLYGEKIFSRKDFDTFCKVMPWNANRFKRAKDKGWIVKFRDERPALYEMSYSAKILIRTFYKVLMGDQILSENGQKNPLFKENAILSYSDLIYKTAMENVNKDIKERRQRPSQE